MCVNALIYRYRLCNRVCRNPLWEACVGLEIHPDMHGWRREDFTLHVSVEEISITVE